MFVHLYNTLSKQKERFVPIRESEVSMYTCGPTVYHFAHIGNLRTYIFEDILKRALTHAGYNVNHVMNITDVGHLQSDADVGADKMDIAAARECRSVWEIAQFYTNKFVEDCEKLNIIPPTSMPRATDHVPEMQTFVEGLEAKGSTYTVEGNVYFDISKFKNYYKFARINPKAAAGQSRVDEDPRKKNQSDFVLWFSTSKYPNQVMKWSSKWGHGCPGWHIECSAMAVKYLGDAIDIHCGGQDHISVHHTNEIAQTEALTGKKWVNFWMHGAFLEDQEGKMSKSKGDFLTLTSLIEKGFEPEHYRYFCLKGHYRKPLKFSMSLLDAARRDFESLRMSIVSLKNKADTTPLAKMSPEHAEIITRYSNEYWCYINDDLDTIHALKVFKAVILDKTLNPHEKLELLHEFDMVLGLSIHNFQQTSLSKRQQILIDMRNSFRQQGLFSRGDVIRNAFQQQGMSLYDESSDSTLCITNRIDHAPRASAASTRYALFAKDASKTSASSTSSLMLSSDNQSSALDDGGPVSPRQFFSTPPAAKSVEEQLFDQKNRSPADRQAFDQRFGLTMKFG